MGGNEQSPIDDFAKLFHERYHSKEVADVVDLKAKVDWQQEDEETCKFLIRKVLSRKMGGQLTETQNPAVFPDIVECHIAAIVRGNMLL